MGCTGSTCTERGLAGGPRARCAVEQVLCHFCLALNPILRRCIQPIGRCACRLSTLACVPSAFAFAQKWWICPRVVREETLIVPVCTVGRLRRVAQPAPVLPTRKHITRTSNPCPRFRFILSHPLLPCCRPLFLLHFCSSWDPMAGHPREDLGDWLSDLWPSLPCSTRGGPLPPPYPRGPHSSTTPPCPLAPLLLFRPCL